MQHISWSQVPLTSLPSGLVTPLTAFSKSVHNRAAFWSKLYRSKAYEQIHIIPEHIHKTAFTTVLGTFKSQVMQMGNCNCYNNHICTCFTLSTWKEKRAKNATNTRQTDNKHHRQYLIWKDKISVRFYTSTRFLTVHQQNLNQISIINGALSDSMSVIVKGAYLLI